jgi:hypothetical protein
MLKFLSRAVLGLLFLAPAAQAQAEATLTLNEAFFNAVLETVFRDFRAPAYPLALSDLVENRRPSRTGQAAHASPQCPSEVAVVREAAGVKTAVKLADGRISAPVAFVGSYKPPLGCFRFQGWADTDMNLEFNREKQTLNLRVTVKSVKLDNVPALLANGPLRNRIQDTLDKRINPLPLLKTEQLTSQMPLAPLGGTLQLRAREVQPEVKTGELRLRISYEFSRVK